MKSSGRRNPDLRNGDENDFVDYDEDTEAEQKSNASDNSTSLSIINEQTADTATQIDDGSEKKWTSGLWWRGWLTLSLTQWYY